MSRAGPPLGAVAGLTNLFGAVPLGQVGRSGRGPEGDTHYLGLARPVQIAVGRAQQASGLGCAKWSVHLVYWQCSLWCRGLGRHGCCLGAPALVRLQPWCLAGGQQAMRNTLGCPRPPGVGAGWAMLSRGCKNAGWCNLALGRVPAWCTSWCSGAPCPPPSANHGRCKAQWYMAPNGDLCFGARAKGQAEGGGGTGHEALGHDAGNAALPCCLAGAAVHRGWANQNLPHA